MPQSEAPTRIHSGRKALAVSLLVLFVSLAGIGALFSLTFRWDNKYTYTGNSLHVLAEGWELAALKSSPLVNMGISNLFITIHRPSVPPFIENSCTLSRQQKDGF